MLTVVLFVIIGAVCIGLEIILPGGVIGVIGIGLMLAATYVAYAQFGVLAAAITFISSVVFAVVLFKLGMKLAPKTPMGRALFLSSDQKGYNVSQNELDSLIGKHGVVDATLRPSGIVVIDSKRYNAITRGEYLEKNTPVVVAERRTNQLLVEVTENTQK